MKLAIIFPPLPFGWTPVAPPSLEYLAALTRRADQESLFQPVTLLDEGRPVRYELAEAVFEEEGWPKLGYESQVNNTFKPDPQKTGGLYNTVKVLEPPAKDNEWWTQHIIVQGKHVVVKINDKTVVDYTEPEKVEGTVKLSSGTFALQAHDPGSTVMYRNIRVKRLP